MCNDLAATAGLSVAQELGVPVPERLSVVGYDDTPSPVTPTPPAVLRPRRQQDVPARAVVRRADRRGRHRAGCARAARTGPRAAGR
ncbi:substrate-binding domain-containing protein [Streptomyces sp. NPDC003781]|uniref:substrate-binding domain-containing protein n=1 Tax=Streptomyces sp. NPDC003781 TaxID=3364686 RepID=UPI0036BD9651